MRAPWIKFFPADWLHGTDLRLVSLAARGLWIDLLCRMHDCTPRGYLVVAGRPLAVEEIAILTGIEVSTARVLLSELEERKVFSRDENGAIFNRRMVREGEVSNVRSEAGKKGGRPSGKQTESKTKAKRKQTESNPKAGGESKPQSNALASSFYISAGDARTEPGTAHEEHPKILAQTPGYDPTPDWLVIESEFIREWNTHAGRGACELSFNAMPYNLAEPFRTAWQTPGWLERARKAMAKFPLRNGTVVSLRQFLVPTTIDEILGGKHDFEPSVRTAATGTGGRRAGQPLPPHLAIGGRPVDPDAEVPF